jgi:ABC-type branched-subunit amino acid transport system substrate-binding protein
LNRKLCWLSLAVALVAGALLVTACGGDNGGPSKTPGAATKAVGTPIGAGDTTGVTDTEIKLGTHYPLSGNPAAVYGTIAYGMKAFFDYINAQGGVYGRKIDFIIGDDHYNPPDTVEVVKKLVEQNKVFAMISGLGEETHSAVWKYLEEKGVPDMYLSTGLDKWTNPVVRTRFAGNPDYVTEGTFLGQYIAKTYPGAKLGILEQSDELGQDGEKGLRKGIEGSDVEITAVEKYEVVQSDVTAQTQRLKNDGVDVVAVFAIPPQAASLVKAARETMNWDVPIIVSAINCSDIFIMLAGAEDAEGVLSSTFGQQAYNTDIPGVQKYEKIWAKFQNGATGDLNNFELYGMFIAEMTVYDLEMAGQDLSRGSFLDAAESTCHFMCSTCVGFGTINLSPTDHRPAETLVINKVENGKWVTVGDVVSYESTPNCTPATPPDGFEDQPQVGADAPYVETP